MRTSTAVALGLGACLLAVGGTAAVVYLQRSKGAPPAASLPVNAGNTRVTVTPPATTATATPAPGPGVAPAPQQSEIQRTAADVQAIAGAAKSVADVVGDVATSLKGFLA